MNIRIANYDVTISARDASRGSSRQSARDTEDLLDLLATMADMSTRYAQEHNDARLSLKFKSAQESIYAALRSRGYYGTRG